MLDVYSSRLRYEYHVWEHAVEERSLVVCDYEDDYSGFARSSYDPR